MYVESSNDREVQAESVHASGDDGVAYASLIRGRLVILLHAAGKDPLAA